MALMNKQVLLAARPEGMPKETDFQFVETPVPDLKTGQVLIRIVYLSVDPYMRGRMSTAESYAPPVEIGEVMTGGAVGKVMESMNPAFRVGEFVAGEFGWQQYKISEGKHLLRLDPKLAPVSTALGVLGMPGATAYFGMIEVAGVKKGETVVVSGAAGAVGSVAGQITKIKGCRTVGIAGSDEKVRYITEQLSFDAGFNYKTVADYGAKLKELCPSGIDAYFDNVGGPITDAVIPLLNLKGRVAVCGQISQYNLEKPEMGPRWLHHLIIKRARVEGFLVMDFAERFPQAFRDLTSWYQVGKLKYTERFTDGIENAPKAFIGMLCGENIGKQLVRVSDERA